MLADCFNDRLIGEDQYNTALRPFFGQHLMHTSDFVLAHDQVTWSALLEFIVNSQKQQKPCDKMGMSPGRRDLR